MFRSGQFVADQLGQIDADGIQPNGVDLRLGSIYRQQSPGRIMTDGKRIGDRDELSAEPASGPQDGTVYSLSPGGYLAVYAETVSIPEGHIGFVLPRSSLMRNSCMLNTAVWDAGYTGRGEGLLEVHHDVEIEQGARIAQLVLAEADHEGLYDGSYQEERLD